MSLIRDLKRRRSRQLLTLSQNTSVELNSQKRSKITETQKRKAKKDRRTQNQAVTIL